MTARTNITITVEPKIESFETKLIDNHVHFDCDVSGEERHFELSCTRVCYLLKEIGVIHFDKARFEYGETFDDAKVDLIDDKDEPHTRLTRDLAADLAPQYAEEIIKTYLEEEQEDSHISEFQKAVA